MIERRQFEPISPVEWINALTGAFVAVAIVILTGITTWFLLSHEIPKDNQTIVGQLQGSLWTSIGGIVGYFYGASVASRAKDRTISTLASTAGAAQAALPPVPGTAAAADVVIEPGQTATVAATTQGETPP